MTFIIDRIREHGGDVIRDRWMFTLRPGRLTPEAMAWVRKNKSRLCAELWPEYDAFEERAAIREYDGGLSRADAEQAAYEDVMSC